LLGIKALSWIKFLVISLTVCLFSVFFFNPGSFQGSFLASASQPTNLFLQSYNNFLRESPDLTLIQDNALKGVSPPATVDPQVLGALLGGVEDVPESRKEIIEHTVKSGETLSSLAEEYSISMETILWANDLTSKSVLKIGQKLVILPVSGVVYNVKQGDTLSEIAEAHKAKVSEIISFNNLSDEGDVFIGDILVVPGGEKPKAVTTYANIPIGSSYFICPHANCYITQGLHWYNAIDFGGKCGDPIYASAGGVVQRVSYGWNYGAGNTITILHPNGVVTGYGHISSSLVVSGQQVSQGEIIALMGGQPGTPGAGISTGCHVHFSVIGAKNPFR